MPTVGDLALGAAQKALGQTLYLIFDLLGYTLSALANLTSIVLNLRVINDVPVVAESWEIMRDFANMFFIVGLIIMAYGTIFDRPNYDYRALLMRFVISAVLVNFSLVLCGLVVDASQVVSNTFLNSMGNIGQQFGNHLNPAELLDPKLGLNSNFSSFTSVANLTFSAVVTLFFAVFLLITYISSLAVVVAVGLARVPVLWLLMVLSPLAVLARMLPSTHSWYKKWEHYFIAWNLFLPFYLFFLFFALHFLSKKDEILATLSRSLADNPETLTNPIAGNFSVGLIFYYFITAFLLIGGAKMAMSASNFSGTRISQVTSWAEKQTARLGAAGRRLSGYDALRQGAQQGVGEKMKDIQQRGLFGYGGQNAFDRRSAAWAERFGATGAKDVQMAKEIGDYKNKLGKVQDETELRRLMTSGPISQQLAAREILKDRGQMSNAEMIDTFEEYSKASSTGAQKFAQSLDYSRFAPQEREKWFNQVRDIETKRKIAGIMAEKGDLRDVSQVQGMLNNLYNKDAIKDRRDFLNKVQKKNILLATEAGIRDGIILDENKKPISLPEITANDPEETEKKRIIEETVARYSRDAIKKMNTDALLESTDVLFNKNTEGNYNTNILGSVFENMSADKFNMMMQKATQEQQDKWQSARSYWDKNHQETAKEQYARESRAASDELRSRGDEARARAGDEGGSRIILTPGAQFEIERDQARERAQTQGNVVDLRRGDREQ